jgi:hypothetical protein
MDKAIGLFASIIMLAALALAISNKARTAQVLNSLFGGMSNLIRAAGAPVTGK